MILRSANPSIHLSDNLSSQPATKYNKSMKPFQKSIHPSNALSKPPNDAVHKTVDQITDLLTKFIQPSIYPPLNG